MNSYNKKRLHSAIAYKTPNEVYYQAINNLDSRREKPLPEVSYRGEIRKVVLLVLKKATIILFSIFNPIKSHNTFILFYLNY